MRKLGNENGKAAPVPAPVMAANADQARQALAILDQATQPNKVAGLTRGDYVLISQALEVLRQFVDAVAGGPAPAAGQAPPLPAAPAPANA